MVIREWVFRKLFNRVIKDGPLGLFQQFLFSKILLHELLNGSMSLAYIVVIYQHGKNEYLKQKIGPDKDDLERKFLHTTEIGT